MAAGYGWHVRTKEAARSAPIVVRSATVGGGIVERSIRLTGVTAAENAVALTAPQLFGSRSIGGRHGDFNLLLQELAPAGSLVKQGDQVASFDRLHMSLRLDEHRTNVSLHEAYMRILTAAFEVRRKAQEQKIDKAKGAVDKAELDLKTAPVRSAIQTERFRLVLEEEKARYKEYLDQWKWFDDSERSSIRRLELDIKEQRLGLQRAERNMDLMAVRAPIPGILVVQTVHRHGGEDGPDSGGRPD